MAFGNVVTDGVRVAVGGSGYIVRFNLQAIDPRSVKQVQLENDGVFSAVISAPVSQAVLYGYIGVIAEEDLPASGIAYALIGRNLDIFLQTSLYPYTSDVRVGYSIYRSANNLTSNTQNLDIPERTRALFKSLVLQELYRGNNKAVPQAVQTAIATEKTKLGYT